MKILFFIIVNSLLLSCFSVTSIESKQVLEKSKRDHVFLRIRSHNTNANQRNLFAGLNSTWFEFRYKEDEGNIELMVVSNTGIYEGYLLDSVIFEIGSSQVPLVTTHSEKREYLEICPDFPSRTKLFNKLKFEFPKKLISQTSQVNNASFSLFTKEFYYKFELSSWDLEVLSELKTL